MTRFGFSVTALATIVLGVLALGVPSSQAGTPANAPPANDDFADAELLDNSQSDLRNGTTRDSTKELGEPDHAGEPGGHSVWYSWTAPVGGLVTIQVDGTDTDNSPLDTVLGVYQGASIGSLTEVASDDDSGGLPASRVSFPARAAGQTFRIAVDSSAGTEGDFQLGLNVQTPVNDDFADATDISNLFGQTLVTETNAGATIQYYETAHAKNDGGASVWYRFAGHDGPVQIDTFGSSFDTVLAAYTSSPDDPTVQTTSPVAANDDLATDVKQSRVRFLASSSVTYWVAVDGHTLPSGLPDEGELSLSIREPEPPDTTLTAAPRNVLKGRRAVTARAAFKSDVANAKFQCRLDSSDWGRCASPRTYSIRTREKAERHAIEVRAIDDLGTPDPTPAKATFKVVRRSKR